MNTMNGFTFPMGQKDIFVKTDYKNKTEQLARKILRKMLLPENPDTVKEILYYLQKAKCDIVTFGNGRQMYEIYGENFGGKGSFVDDGMTVIVEI